MAKRSSKKSAPKKTGRGGARSSSAKSKKSAGKRGGSKSGPSKRTSGKKKSPGKKRAPSKGASARRKSTGRSTGKPTGRPKSKKRRAAPPIAKPEGPQRLQRLLAAAGYGSRRQCETLIEEGRVMVDGEIVTKLGTSVDPKTQKVRIDGVYLRAQKKVYYAVNKPKGVVTTNADPHGRPRVIDFVPRSERVFPVGRLDRSSEGLILLTNDGDLAQLLAHPKYGVRKVYRVTVAGKVEPLTMQKMREGIYIAEGLVKVEGARILKSRPKATEMEIVLREGKNREIRRILARMGHKVQTLRRIAIGTLRLGDVPAGAYRLVSREEVRKLQADAHSTREKVDAEEDEAPRRRAKGRATKKRAGKKVPSTVYGKRKTAKTDSAKKTTVRKTPARKTSTRAASKSKPEFEIKLTGFSDGAAPRIGAVIGGDAPESSEPSTKRNKKSGGKKTAAKRGRSSSGRSSSNRRTSKSKAKRGRR